eukprot:633048-Hanusia_phi.AAC.7
MRFFNIFTTSLYVSLLFWDHARGEYCSSQFDPALGKDGCEKFRGCCFKLGLCLPCQKLNGVWQGIVGKCVFDTVGDSRNPIAATVYGNFTTGECIPVTGQDGKPLSDASVIMFHNASGCMGSNLKICSLNDSSPIVQGGW